MLDIKTRTVDEVKVMDLFGSIDLDGVRALKEKLQDLRKSGVSTLAINFENVQTAQSALLQQLVTPIRAQVGMGGKIAFCAMNSSVSKIIASSMIKPMIDIHETVEAAIAKYNAK